MQQPGVIATFSIVAADPEKQEIGAAVQSKFLAVGAVAIQSYANTSYGARGLTLMSLGLHPDRVIQRLIEDDPDSVLRQVGVVDAKGRSATFSGSDCHDWAGGRAGEHYAAQGNILVSGDTVGATSETFEGATGSLATRLLQALAAGPAAGGDRRGRQSASLLVVRPKGGYGGWSDRWLDLRVDDHPTPISELKRLYTLHQLYFGEPEESDLIPLSLELVTEIQKHLVTFGYYTGESNGQFDATTQQAMADWAGVENLEERMR